MNTNAAREIDRVNELLADEAAGALESNDGPELANLLGRNPGVARDELFKAAALAQVAFLRRDRPGRMPAALRERVASQGEALTFRQRVPLPATRQSPAPLQPPPVRRIEPAIAARRWSPGAGVGWALAAALAVALVLVRNEAPVVAPAPDMAVATVASRASLLNSEPDVITLPWSPPAAEGYRGVTGDVVWSQSRQQGYLRLANMPVNDPARTQYQLWIVDPERDTHPVDGGVFNVSRTGEVIIPIQAKLQIRAPKAFAITAEKPGGVVVSAGPLLVVAST